MKKFYKKPTTDIVLLKVSQALLTASSVGTEDYNSTKHTVLSRGNRDSFWDDEEEEEY